MPDATTDRITRLGPADTDHAARLLAGAFTEDPIFRWIAPDAESRPTRLEAVFAAFAEVYEPHGESYLAEGAGAALWLPAGAVAVNEDQLEWFGNQMSTALGVDAERAFELEAHLDSHHPDEPCAYLQFMGVVPDHQGRGLGSRLLETMLRRCDASGTPAYLEATSVDNRRLYQRHGFETRSEIAIPGGPSLWSMWREPTTGHGR